MSLLSVDLVRCTFYTMQRYGKGEFGLKQRDGFTFNVENVVYTAHCLDDEETVVISDKCTGNSIKNISVLSSDERDRAERAVEIFIQDRKLLDKLKAYQNSPKYANLRRAFELMNEACSHINTAEGC